MTQFNAKVRHLLADDQGQVLPFVAVILIAMLGMAALAIDTGRAMYTSRELQAATDSAALAGAQAIPTSDSPAAITGGNVTGSGGVVGKYSAIPGGWNERTSLPSVTEVSTLKCLAAVEAAGEPCIGAVPYNAIQVTQTSVLPMYFAGLFGHKTFTLTAVATAARTASKPANVAVIVDTTLSMSQADSDCGATQIQCALNGVQVLLQHLSPCTQGQASCTGSNSFDRVSLFTFPNVTEGTAGIDANCTTPIPGGKGYPYNNSFGYYSMLPSQAWNGVPTAVAYSFPVPTATAYVPTGSATPTYEITNFLSDYRISDTTGSLNQTSQLVKAAGGATGCGGISPSNYDGEYGTYYAGVIYAAQAALVAEQAQFPGSQNVIILLSDGDATAPQTENGYPSMAPQATASGTYPSWIGECGQAVDAAAYATGHGTTVYTVAYGAEPTGCASDAAGGSHLNISPCNTMQEMASNPHFFYSDYKQTGSNSTCYASQPVTSLNDIFAAIAGDFSSARLIPNNTV